jgi:hypothetical protein
MVLPLIDVITDEAFLRELARQFAYLFQELR